MASLLAYGNMGSDCVQGHIDMVCEKNNDVQHDFHKDALKLIKKGEWLKVSYALVYESIITVCSWHDQVQHVPMTETTG